MTTSLLEALNTDRTVADKARFVDYFVGDSVKTWWTITNKAGSGTVSINDSVDGGLDITTSSIANAETEIDFNDIRPFSNTGSIFQTTTKRVTASTRMMCGFVETGDFLSSFALYEDSTALTYPRISTDDGTTNTTSDTTISINTQYNNIRFELTSTSMPVTINNSLNITKTTNLPDVAQQPFFNARYLGTGIATIQANYCEAWNT